MDNLDYCNIKTALTNMQKDVRSIKQDSQQIFLQCEIIMADLVALLGKLQQLQLAENDN